MCGWGTRHFFINADKNTLNVPYFPLGVQVSWPRLMEVRDGADIPPQWPLSSTPRIQSVGYFHSSGSSWVRQCGYSRLESWNIEFSRNISYSEPPDTLFQDSLATLAGRREKPLCFGNNCFAVEQDWCLWLVWGFLEGTVNIKTRIQRAFLLI